MAGGEWRRRDWRAEIWGRWTLVAGSVTNQAMAQRHMEKAGQWAKEKSREKAKAILFASLVLALLGGFASGLVVGFMHQPALAAAIATVVAPLVWWMLRRTERLSDKWGRERINYMRGGQAEAFVSALLTRTPTSWHLFDNLPNPEGGDIDHVVVGPGGVFVISTKGYKGHVTRASNGTILLNGRPITDFEDVKRQARQIYMRIKAVRGGEARWVQPVLAMPLAKIDVPPKENPVWIVDDDTLLDAIPFEGGKATLTKAMIDEIVDVLMRPVRA